MSAEERVTHEIDLVAAWSALAMPRIIEEKMLRLIRQGRIAKWFSGYGQEAIAVGVALALEERDYIVPTHRNLGVWTTRKVPLRPLFCQLMGRAGGYTKGRDRTFHFGLPQERIVGMISHVGAMLPVACGLGFAAQYRDEDCVTAVFVGDGASREGDFHEAMNLAACWKLPVIFVLENNGYGLSTPTSEAMAVEHLADAAAGYGMAGERVDGNDFMEVYRFVTAAARLARTGGGPTLLEMKTFRVRGHEEASGVKYVPPELIEEWMSRDPVERFRAAMLEEEIMSREQIEAVQTRLEAEVDDAAEFALAQPLVESSPEAEKRDVFAPATAKAADPGKDASEIRFIDAVTDGLRLAMQKDVDVVLFGQDIAEYGGVFKVTAGFLDEFGRDRVRNTPIIESGAIGAAMGMALRGLKPVVEMQYADFITCGFNQVVNNLATTHYRWGQPLNVTIRAPYGGHIGAGPFHSQCVEAWFTSVPGLKVVVPGTPHDAKGLLIAAIEDPNPVLFFEHKFLYRSLKGMVPDGHYSTEIGRARIVRVGTDATIVTYGLGVQWALAAAEMQASQGREIEIVDLRTLAPWDRATVIDSVKKTGRALVLHEAPLTGGFGGEIAATIAEETFQYLDAPPVRVAGEDVPIPFSPNLESEIFSARARFGEALERLLTY